jgi:hypothetical protein
MTAGSATILRGITALRARSLSSSGATVIPAKYHSSFALGIDPVLVQGS